MKYIVVHTVGTTKVAVPTTKKAFRTLQESGPFTGLFLGEVAYLCVDAVPQQIRKEEAEVLKEFSS